MQRRGEDYWREAIRRHAVSGMSAAKYCRKHHLGRGTFLRWRKRLEDSTLAGKDFVEVRERARIAEGRNDSVLEVRVGSDIRIAVKIGDDLEFVASIIAAIRRAG
jgi:hypothetical protein